MKRQARKPDPSAIVAVLERHPLRSLSCITVKLKYEPQSGYYVTWIPELNGISTYGETPEEALDQTKDLIAGWLASMEANQFPIPLTPEQLAEIRAVLSA